MRTRQPKIQFMITLFKHIQYGAPLSNPKVTKMEKYLRAKDTAQYLGVGVSTIWLFTKQNKIKSIKLSDRVTVWAKGELDAFIASRMEAVA